MASTSTPLPSVLAWAGWLVRIPEDWRPFKVRGDQSRGSMLVGDMGHIVFQLKWWTPNQKPGAFKPAEWMLYRLRKILPKGYRTQEGPSPRGFAETRYVPNAGKDQQKKHIWYGYSPDAHLVLEIVFNAAQLPPRHGNLVREILQSCEATSREDPVRWCVFETAFETPPGYQLQDKKLQVGDMAMSFTTRDGKRLIVRQVYPASAALVKRPLQRWLKITPFREKRRHYKPLDEVQDCEITSFGRSLQALCRHGAKRLPFPLGRVRPRYSRAVVAHDADLERLLYAEHDTRQDEDDSVIRRAVGRMNWSRLDVHHQDAS